jgi:hypothetical protein
MDDLGDRIRRQVERSIEESMDDAGHDRESEEGGVNIAGRVNKAVAANVGDPGSVQGVSSKQRVRIRQNDGETYEESETIKTTFPDQGG